MLKFLVLPPLFFGLVAFAANGGAVQRAAPPRGETLKPVDCGALEKKEALIAEIEQLKSMAGEHHSAVNLFLDDITTRLDGWHKAWTGFEGKAGVIPADTFSPLKRTAEEVGEIQNEVVWKNLGSVEERFDAVLNCLDQQKSK